jgi:hypothetical protein
VAVAVAVVPVVKLQRLPEELVVPEEGATVQMVLMPLLQVVLPVAVAVALVLQAVLPESVVVDSLELQVRQELPETVVQEVPDNHVVASRSEVFRVAAAAAAALMAAAAADLPVHQVAQEMIKVPVVVVPVVLTTTEV